MQIILVLKLVALLVVANGAPILASRLLRRRLAFPLDGGLTLWDGRPLFGASKTARGVIVAIVAAAAGAPLLALDWWIGALLGLGAMAGDLFSSFVKRRMGLPSSARATGLDQVPEALFPLLACAAALDLSAPDILAGVALFFVAGVVLSLVFYILGVRKQPH